MSLHSDSFNLIVSHAAQNPALTISAVPDISGTYKIFLQANKAATDTDTVPAIEITSIIPAHLNKIIGSKLVQRGSAVPITLLSTKDLKDLMDRLEPHDRFVF